MNDYVMIKKEDCYLLLSDESYMLFSSLCIKCVGYASSFRPEQQIMVDEHANPHLCLEKLTDLRPEFVSFSKGSNVLECLFHDM
jgi:hypothetical protein